ncbi:MAG TPA: NUDIX hydrolase [Lacunisphaera sp.]|jgi:8-oxo-dGTP pyrophosphatase MutT (NUDIX family)|nr:NUDIX hydrolase [Lacunisphaera sp.]
MPESPPRPQRWHRLRAEPHATTRIFEVTRTFYRHPHRAQEQDFFVINAPDWVNVVALTPRHEIVLVRQFRYGINEFSLEIPGGIMEPGEDAVAAGARELREETGYVGPAARLLGSVHPNPAMQSNRCHLVLVTDARPDAGLAWDPDEEFEIMTRPVDEVYALARRGEITHAMVLDALLLFAPVWEQLKQAG